MNRLRIGASFKSCRAMGVVAMLAFALTWVSGVTTVSAQSDEEARALFRAGDLAFSEGRFDVALEYFQRSYEISGHAGLLFNIANVQDRLRHTREAAEAYEAYLEAAPDAPNAAFARNRARTLRDELAQTQPATAEPAPTTEPAASEAPSSSSSDPPSRESRLTESSSGDVSGDGPSAAGIALTVVGGALVAASIGTIIWFADRASAVDQCNATPSCVNGNVMAGERDAALGTTIALGVAGLAMLGVGIALLVSQEDSGESASIHCVPGPLGIACAGRF